VKTEIIHDIFNKLSKDSISFIYQGNFTNQVLGMATDLLKNHLEKKMNLISLRNKLSFLMIESFQNIVRYADSHRHTETKELTHEIFLTRNIDDTFYIITSNLIENEKIGYVKEKLYEVNNLSEDELKTLYIKILKNRKISEKGGAGLGFIEMVRKTKGKIEFDFVPLNDEVSFFYFQITLRNPKEKGNFYNPEIRETKVLHKIFSEQNVLIAQKGNFSQEAIKPVLIMVQDNIKHDDLSEQKKIFHIMVETLQNISKHAYCKDTKREGIFILCKNENEYSINTGNYIEKNKAQELKNYLEKLQSFSKDQLDEFYKKVLRDGNFFNGNEKGIGFVDIMRECYGKIKFDFFEVDNNLSFFALSLQI